MDMDREKLVEVCKDIIEIIYSEMWQEGNDGFDYRKFALDKLKSNGIEYEILYEYSREFLVESSKDSIYGYDFMKNIIRFYFGQAHLIEYSRGEAEELAEKLYYYTILAGIRELRHAENVVLNSENMCESDIEYIENSLGFEIPEITKNQYSIKFIYELFELPTFPLWMWAIYNYGNPFSAISHVLNYCSPVKNHKELWSLYKYIDLTEIDWWWERFTKWKWKGGFGGKKWYYIVKGLEFYDKKIIFIDRQVHAQHNNSIYLDKIGVDVNELNWFLSVKSNNIDEAFKINEFRIAAGLEPLNEEKLKDVNYKVSTISAKLKKADLEIFKEIEIEIISTGIKLFDVSQKEVAYAS